MDKIGRGRPRKTDTFTGDVKYRSKRTLKYEFGERERIYGVVIFIRLPVHQYEQIRDRSIDKAQPISFTIREIIKEALK